MINQKHTQKAKWLPNLKNGFYIQMRLIYRFSKGQKRGS